MLAERHHTRRRTTTAHPLALPSTRLIQLAALFDQSLLGLVALLQCPVQLLILAAEALQALITHELLQHLRSTRRRSKANAKHGPARGSAPPGSRSQATRRRLSRSPRRSRLASRLPPAGARGDALRETATATVARAERTMAETLRTYRWKKENTHALPWLSPLPSSARRISRRTRPLPCVWSCLPRVRVVREKTSRPRKTALG